MKNSTSDWSLYDCFPSTVDRIIYLAIENMLFGPYKSLFQPKPLIIVLDSDNRSRPPLAAALAVQWIQAMAESAHNCGVAIMDSALVAADSSNDSSWAAFRHRWYPLHC